jgi:hypothetical protein
VSVESKHLRDRAAGQLRAGRRTKDASHKTSHNQRAASLKARAHNEEWLAGERERSKLETPLSSEDCLDQAQRCRALARQVMTESHRVMLNHIGDTWERVAADIDKTPRKRTGK